MARIVVPLLDGYKPDVIVVASGIDANAVDPTLKLTRAQRSSQRIAVSRAESDAHLLGQIQCVDAFQRPDQRLATVAGDRRSPSTSTRAAR